MLGEERAAAQRPRSRNDLITRGDGALITAAGPPKEHCLLSAAMREAFAPRDLGLSGLLLEVYLEVAMLVGAKQSGCLLFADGHYILISFAGAARSSADRGSGYA